MVETPSDRKRIEFAIRRVNSMGIITFAAFGGV